MSFRPLRSATACICASILLVTGCAGAPASGATSSTAASASSSAVDLRAAREHSMFDVLRPPGATPFLEAIERSPRESDVYADAAAFYAGTRAAGMTLFWAQTYRLLAPEGPRGAEMATLVREVLASRVTITSEGGEWHLGTQLAPGDVPVLAFSGGPMLAPFAHRYEIAIGTAIALGERGRDTLDQVASIFAAYPHVAFPSEHTPFTTETELSAYLLELEANGHVVAYGHWVVGPAFPEEWEPYQRASATRLDAFARYLGEHPFTPTRGVRPDDLAELAQLR